MNRILVAVDGSRCAQDALETVVRLDWLPGTNIKLVHVHNDPGLLSSMFSAFGHRSQSQPDNEAVREILEDVARGMQNRLGDSVLINCQLLEGDTVAALLTFANSWKPDQIVVGTRGMTGLESVVLGSVSQGLVERAPCPVLIAREPHDGAGNILVGVDDSICTAIAIEWLMTQHWIRGKHISLLAVMESTPQTSFADDLNSASRKLLIWQNEKLKMDRTLRAWSSLLQAQGALRAVSCGIVEGDAAEMLMKGAANWPADLIVLGSHGRSGISKMLLGSVSQKVAANAGCSVEVVRGDQSVYYDEISALWDQTEDGLSELLNRKNAPVDDQGGPVESPHLPPMGF